MSLVVGVGILLVGTYVLLWGYRRRTYHQVIDRTPTSRVLDVSEPGLVELTGEARALEDADGEQRTISAPLTGDDALIAGWHVEEWQRSGEHSSWQDVADGYDSVPFLLDDGSATIRVEPRSRVSNSGFLTGVPSVGSLTDSVETNGTTIDFERFNREYQLQPDDPRPERITSFERTAPGVDEQTGSFLNVIDIGNAQGERKYHEATIEPGDDVYLLGTVDSRHDDDDAARYQRLHPDDAVVTPATDDPFVVSARTQDELLAGTRWGTPVFLLGLAILVVGMYVILAW